jgi:hypothetical protein
VTKPNFDDFTVPEKILVAADQLETQGHSPFTAEALIVAVWQKFPTTFGLKGYHELYPDSNKVFASLMGEKGLARRGWLVKTGQKMYALTREGRKVIRRVTMQEGDEPEEPRLHRLSRELERFVVALLDSSAYQKYEENRKAELSFADACRFWGITENMRGDELDEKLSLATKSLAELERLSAETDAQLSSGRVLTSGDIRVLKHSHDFMADRFERHLNLLRSRTAKR